MKRAILLLAVAALFGATGCHSRCDRKLLTIDWIFVDATGTTLSCSASGTAFVRVFVNDQQIADDFGNPIDFTCADPAIVDIDVPTGSDKIQIDAVDANGGLLYQYVQPALPVSGCSNQALSVDLTAVQAPLQVSYSIANGNQCPPNTFLWYSLFDVTDNLPFSVVDGLPQPTSVPCGTEIVFPTALFGDYRLDFIQVVAPTGNPAQPYSALFEYCTPTPFNHASANDVLVVPTLTAATGFCQ